MRKLFIILSLLCLTASVPLAGWGQANLPFSPNSSPVQGPDPTGLMGYPLAIVGSPGGTNVNVFANGGSFTATNGFVSIVNSTTIPLAPNQTFTGQFESTLGYSTIEAFVSVLPTSAGSGTNLVQVQWSWNGVTVDFQDTWTAFANTSGNVQGQTFRTYDTEVKGPFVRYSYGNASVQQTQFSSGLIFHTFPKNVQLTQAQSFIGSISPITGLPVQGFTWDPVVANGQQVLLNSASRTATTTSFVFRNTGFHTAVFNLNVISVPAVPGAGGLDLSILQLDGSNNQFAINAPASMSAWITAPGLYRWVVAPGTTGSGLSSGIRQCLSVPVPFKFQGQVIAHDAQAYIYNLQVDLGP